MISPPPPPPCLLSSRSPLRNFPPSGGVTQGVPPLSRLEESRGAFLTMCAPFRCTTINGDNFVLVCFVLFFVCVFCCSRRMPVCVPETPDGRYNMTTFLGRGAQSKHGRLYLSPPAPLAWRKYPAVAASPPPDCNPSMLITQPLLTKERSDMSQCALRCEPLIGQERCAAPSLFVSGVLFGVGQNLVSYVSIERRLYTCRGARDATFVLDPLETSKRVNNDRVGHMFAGINSSSRPTLAVVKIGRAHV